METSSLNRRCLLGSTGALALSAILPASAEAAPNVTGEWSPVYKWPDVAIHLSLTKDGILSWADDDAVYPDRNAGFSKTFKVRIPTGKSPLSTWQSYPNTVTIRDLLGGSSLGALEQEMFEEVRGARQAIGLVTRADVEPEADGRRPNLGHLLRDDR